MFCYLLTYLNGHKTVVVSKKEFFSLNVADYAFEHSQIVSVQMLNADSVIVVPA